MPAPKNTPAETPGEAPPVEVVEEAPAAPAARPPETAESLAAKDALLKQQVAATAKLVGSKGALNWDHLNSAAAVQPGYTPVVPELPDQADIDPDTLKAPVLSKQGWVLPTNDPRARFGGR